MAFFEGEIVTCSRCPRLRAHCAEIARVKRKAYAQQTYWGKPLPGFGDPAARLWVVGLAPGNHGANRTGRVFTGDRSGEWLYRVLFEKGFSSSPASIGPGDTLELKGAYISCAVRCAPPDNKPSVQELAACAPFLERELKVLTQARVIVALGAVATQAVARLYPQTPLAFKHGTETRLPDARSLLCCYHPSQQNTFTGRLTWKMWDEVFGRARALAWHPSSGA